MAPHSSTLAWKIPWMEEPGRLQATGSLRVGHDWATSLSLFLSCIGEGNSNPLQCSCLENPRDGGAWWAAICGVAQSRTRLKWRSSSSSSRQIIWRTAWQPTLVLLPGESHGQRNMVGYGSQGHRDIWSDLACMQANNYAGLDQSTNSWVLRNDHNFNIFKIRIKGTNPNLDP